MYIEQSEDKRYRVFILDEIRYKADGETRLIFMARDHVPGKQRLRYEEVSDNAGGWHLGARYIKRGERWERC